MKKLCLMLMAVLLILCSACSNSSLENAGKELGDSVASAVDSNNKYVLMVKNGYRENNPTLTYDKAFSAFFGTPRWKYFKGDNKQDVVEFTGDCTYQDIAVKARIQFVVDEKQGTFEAAYLSFNEVPQNAFILSALITKAFEDNKKPGSSPNTSQTNAAQIDQNALKTLYGKWGDDNNGKTVTKLTFTKDMIDTARYDVLEARTEYDRVTGRVSGYEFRIKIYIQNPYVAKISINLVRVPSGNDQLLMEIYDETNGRDLTNNLPYIKVGQ